MNMPAVDSSLDVAGWFINRAQKDEWYLENEKIHNLLFLAQFHYALQNDMKLLMPSFFMVDGNGFKEPNIDRILQIDRNFFVPNRMSEKTNDFLQKIWQVYGSMSLKQLSQIIQNQTEYLGDYDLNTKNLVDFKSLIEKFKTRDIITKAKNVKKTNEKKILISQNGPVVVSKWQPRKLDS